MATNHSHSTSGETVARNRPVEGNTVCLTCAALPCLCRPRFYAGQLLTDNDLNALEQYVIEKNKLHNRMLHGWGVACGLTVTCDPCDGRRVTVGAGYAIDKCGNDIVVCEDETFLVIEEIQKYRRRQARLPDCDPYGRTRSRDGCDEREECWYVTLTYREAESLSRPVLKRSVSGQCGCGGQGDGGRGCGCGGGNGSGNGNGQSRQDLGRYGASSPATNGGYATGRTTSGPRAPTGVTSCEPTRICESYHLEVCPRPSMEPLWGKDYWSIMWRVFNYLEDTAGGAELALALARGPAVAQLAASVHSVLAQLEPNTFGYQALSCVARVLDVFEKVAPTRQRALADKAPARDYQDYFCTLRDSLYALLRDVAVTDCQLRSELDCVHCEPLPVEETEKPGEALAAYRVRVDAQIEQLHDLTRRLIRQCLCHSVLPTCPQPDEDRPLILARVTVRGDCVVDICHFEGRRQLLTAPALLYWLNDNPKGHWARERLSAFCCGDDCGPRRGEAAAQRERNQLADLLACTPALFGLDALRWPMDARESTATTSSEGEGPEPEAAP